MGAQKISIKYRPGKENQQADSLSRNPVFPAPVSGDAEDEVQIAMTTTAVDNSQQIVPKSSLNTNLEDLTSTQIGEVTRDGTMDALPDTVSSERSSSNDFADLLQLSPVGIQDRETFRDAQKKDPYLSLLIDCVENGKLPEGPAMSKRVLALSPHLVMINKLLHFVDTDSAGGVRQRVCVPRKFQQQILHGSHGGFFSGHFSGKRLYSTLCRRWWWDRMYSDALEYCKSCPECATVTGGGRVAKPPLHPIHVERPFQILGVDVMELPKTTSGNKYALVFQDYLTKWPMVFAMPDQKSTRIVDILVHEVMPLVGVPESLLSDRGTNLLSFIMKDVCSLLGIEKLNTTAYHPQCDGLVERFNRTLKTMLCKHAARYGNQWDKYLSAVVWSYRNTPHEATREKPSFLLFGVDLRTPTEATYLPPTELSATNVSDYRRELITSLRSARRLAAENIQEAQSKYKTQYDKSSRKTSYSTGDWVLVRFPQEESGRMRKLSRLWHGPFRVLEAKEPDVTVVNVYFPQDRSIQVHASRVRPCPPNFPAGFYWYGGRDVGQDDHPGGLINCSSRRLCLTRGERRIVRLIKVMIMNMQQKWIQK